MSATQTTILDEGRLRVATEFLPLLRENQLDTFDRAMTLHSAEVARSFPGRNTVRVQLKSPSGQPRAFYLKRYERQYLSAGRFFLRLIRWPGAEDEAMREWRRLHELHTATFAVPTPVAVGQEKILGVPVRSFVMTKEIAGGQQGDHYCRDLAAPERRALAAEVADLSRRFHAAGFVHKDYYLCHIFVAPNRDRRELFLIDLQRVRRPRWFRERSIVKDLGALAYSALKFGGSRTDLMRFLRRYRGKTQLEDADKRLAHKVLARVKWLSRRRPKHDADFEQVKRL